MFHLNRPRQGFYGSVAGEKSFDKAHRGFSGISPGNDIASTGCVSYTYPSIGQPYGCGGACLPHSRLGAVPLRVSTPV
jgi:hypothetical protein